MPEGYIICLKLARENINLALERRKEEKTTKEVSSVLPKTRSCEGLPFIKAIYHRLACCISDGKNEAFDFTNLLTYHSNFTCFLKRDIFYCFSKLHK